MSLFPHFTEKDLPVAPPWWKSIGVGVVVMGMAMGTGELILWPHLVTKYGLGLLWLALVGITLQFFLNLEIARHTLATGESFFTSSARFLSWSPLFWLPAVILLYVWPGWASALGTILANFFGFGSYLIWAWISLGLVLALTFFGRSAYLMLERSLKITVPVFLVLLIAISIFNLGKNELAAAGAGLINFGWLPEGIDLQVLLGAIVFSGAGGMLNLCVSLWYRDKRAGMGAYVGHIENPVTGRTEAVSATGFKFPETRANLIRWRAWMRFVLFDQGIVFWLTGLVSMILLSLNAYAVLTPLGIVPEGTQVAVAQAQIFSSKWGLWGEKIYLGMAYLMLFSVMWTVLDAMVRVASDIVFVNSRAGKLQPYFKWLSRISIHHLYYGLILIAVVFQAVLLPLKQPLPFLVISSVLGGLTMALYSPLLLYLNNFKLPRALRPGIVTNLVLVLCTVFYWYFSYQIIAARIF